MANNVFQFPHKEAETVSRDVDESLREGFEAWAERAGYDLDRFPLQRNEYMFADTQWAWIGWCGATMAHADAQKKDGRGLAEQAVEHVISAVRKQAHEAGRREGLAEAQSKHDLFSTPPASGLRVHDVRLAMTQAKDAATHAGGNVAEWYQAIAQYIEDAEHKLERYVTLCDVAAETLADAPEAWRRVFAHGAKGQAFKLDSLTRDDDDSPE